ncbi:MAG: hypothetical protein IJ262_00295 [Clostridia bacterium]|nr:hypothetical protein [Clostridia bacterium]
MIFTVLKTEKAPNCYVGSLFMKILTNENYFEASSIATAHATVIPTMGLLP